MAECIHVYGQWDFREDPEGRKIWFRKCLLCGKEKISRRKQPTVQMVHDAIIAKTGIILK